MYTSDIKTGMKYLAASIVIAIAAAVYGLFSHGVYSYFMTYAFMIPLLGGALPHLISAMKSREAAADIREAGHDGASAVNVQTGTTDGEAQAGPADGEAQTGSAKMPDAKETQLAIIATLTAGSLLKGVLDIYGTTNRLLIAYPVIAVIILTIAIVSFVRNGGDLRTLVKNK